jgi:hypothetical protein
LYLHCHICVVGLLLLFLFYFFFFSFRSSDLLKIGGSLNLIKGALRVVYLWVFFVFSLYFGVRYFLYSLLVCILLVYPFFILYFPFKIINSNSFLVFYLMLNK